MTGAERKVILASSLGTVFEWYDFYLYGSLASIIAKQFFSNLDATSAFIEAARTAATLVVLAIRAAVRASPHALHGRLALKRPRAYPVLPSAPVVPRGKCCSG